MFLYRPPRKSVSGQSLRASRTGASKIEREKHFSDRGQMSLRPHYDVNATALLATLRDSSFSINTFNWRKSAEIWSKPKIWRWPLYQWGEAAPQQPTRDTHPSHYWDRKPKLKLNSCGEWSHISRPAYWHWFYCYMFDRTCDHVTTMRLGIHLRRLQPLNNQL